MRKRLLMIVVAAAMTAMMSMTVFAGVSLDGTKGNWISNDTGWWWQNEDGTWPHSGWFWLDGNEDGAAECYLFDGNGYMMTNTISGDGFRVNADGAWVDANGVVQTRRTDSLTNPAVQQPSVNTGVTTTTDNGGYNEYGCSNVAIEMLHNSREENAKFGEVSVLDQGIGIYITYANGFGVAYPTASTGHYKTVQVDTTRNDLDPTHMFKYYDSALTDPDKIADYFYSIGFEGGIEGTWSSGLTCHIKVGDRAAIDWNNRGVIVLR